MRAFLKTEAAGGILLMGAAAAGLLIANSPVSPAYFSALHAQIGPFSVLHWVNDGLMSVFFLLVGLEVKRELIDGQLSTWSRRALPGLAALGGMAAPAAVYLLLAGQAPGASRGWAIPAATDIAFTLGVLALLGRRVPVSLKIFVTALAIVDDLGAVVVIAAFYTAQLHGGWLAAAVGVLLLLSTLGWLRARVLWPYLALGVVLWGCVLQSGVHATLAGVALAFTIPLTRSPARPEPDGSPLHRLEHGLTRWVAFGVLPIFAFTNAGVSLRGLGLDSLLAPVTIAVALGLFLGKQIGILAATVAAVRLRLAERPDQASWLQVYGASVLCGIGFTMSLFIGLLAFPSSPLLQSEVKVGVLFGSLLSAIVGSAVLFFAHRSPRASPGEAPPIP